LKPGDGAQLKSLCFVSDMVEGLLQFLAMDDGAGTVLNLGSDEGIRMAEVASMITRLTASRSMIREEPEAEPPLDGLVPEITRAKEMLGWTPKVNLEEGLKKTIEYYRSNVTKSDQKVLRRRSRAA
jgi:UDP-glucuronate decarboxylase